MSFSSRVATRVVHVRADDLLDEPEPSARTPGRGLGRRRQLSGLVLALLGLPLVTLGLHATRGTLTAESQVLLYLLAVVAIALVGGVVVALLAAVAAALLINYFFIVPLHTLDIARGEQALALGVFVVVAGVVSGAVEIATRRARAAEQAAAQAETLSALAGTDLDEVHTLRGVLERARQTFSMESVAFKVRDRGSGTWDEIEHAGWAPAGQEAPLRFDVPVGTGFRLIGRGPALFAEDRQVLGAFAAAAETAYTGRQLSQQAREARSLAVVDRQRTALLAAVGHDLRTPLAGIKAAVSSLRQSDVDWSPEEREELLATIEESGDRLDAVVANLLDASRLEAGALSVNPQAVALDEVVGAALISLPEATDRVDVDVPDDIPLIRADPGLVERIVVNLVSNALHHAPGPAPVRIVATAGATSATLEVIDRGPGVSAERRDELFQPFRRLDDRGAGSGVGLGLSVARGFAEAMDGALVADRSPGGGLTLRLRLPVAGPDRELPTGRPGPG